MSEPVLHRRGRPPRDAQRDTRQALLDAGLDLFAEKGFFGTSIREIAERIGVRESAVYHYFEGKEALFQAILYEQAEHAPVTEVLPDGPIQDPAALLIDLGQRIVARWSDPRAQKLFRIMMSDGLRLATEGRINLFDSSGRAQAMAEKLMERLIQDGWLKQAPPLLLALEFMASFIVWQQVQAIDPNHPLVAGVDSFVRAHVAHFLHGASQKP